MSESATPRSAFVESLGMHLVESEAGGIELQLPIRPEFLNSGGVVHGGVYASLADSVLGALIHARIPPAKMALTLELSCRYLRAARAGTLCGTGRIVHLGRRTVMAEAEIALDGKILVKASGSFLLVERADVNKSNEEAG